MRGSRLIGLAAILVAAGPAVAQWTVASLHPVGASDSGALAVSGPTLAGYRVGGGVFHAVYGGLGPLTQFLPPSEAVESFAYAVGGGQAGGSYALVGFSHAAVWTLVPGPVLEDLHPLGATSSVVFGLSGARQVGSAVTLNAARAVMWSGTAASMVDMHPAGAVWSEAYAISDDRIVGAVAVAPTGAPHAAMWSAASPGSWVDLHPADATWSVANAVSGTRQAGAVGVGGERHAAIWSGTPGSFLDLSPPGTDDSVIWGASEGWQAGQARVGVYDHAIAWNSLPSAWADLHLLLPPRYSSSVAFAVWADNSLVRVVGKAHNDQTGRDEAMLWSRPLAPLPDPNYLYNNWDGAATAAPGNGFNPQFTTASGVPGPSSARWRESPSDGAGVDPVFNSVLGVAFGAAPTSTAVADDFTVPAGQTWTITRVNVFGCQAGTSPFLFQTIYGATLKIWGGPPGAVGSPLLYSGQVEFLEAPVWTGLYNVGATTGCSPVAATANMPIMRMELPLQPLLVGPGTYWLEVSASGELFFGAVLTPTQVYGQGVRGRASDNALERVGGVWSPIVDPGMCGTPSPVGQDLSFEILGVEGALCVSVADLTKTAIPGTPGYGVPDNKLTTDDFFYFLQLYTGNVGCSGAACPTPPDLTGSATPGAPGYGVPDAMLNGEDLFYYLGLYAAGC